MSWIRLSDDYTDHPKFAHLSDGAFRLWHQGLAYCRKFQTDGLIPTIMMRSFHAYSPKRMRELQTPWMESAAPLWETVDGVGVKIHDYLVWNLSKEEEEQQRLEAKQRMALSRDPEMRKALQTRDGSHCRYCGRIVSWADRRGTGGATYDHVDPNGGDLLDNLVIACRGCNSRKGSRTPEGAGLTLRPAPNPQVELVIRSRSRLESNPSVSGKGMGMDLLTTNKSTSHVAQLEGDDCTHEVRMVAAEFMAAYPRLFASQRHGAHYQVREARDWPAFVELAKGWPDVKRLSDMFCVFLNLDPKHAVNAQGTPRQFLHHASECDGLLRKNGR